jgi:hypothetical protein
MSYYPYKTLKYTPSGRWDAYTRGGCAIIVHVFAPHMWKLAAKVVYELSIYT